MPYSGMYHGNGSMGAVHVILSCCSHMQSFGAPFSYVEELFFFLACKTNYVGHLLRNIYICVIPLIVLCITRKNWWQQAVDMSSYR